MSDTYVAPSRHEKKSLTVWIDPAIHKAIKMTAITADMSVQAFVEQACIREVNRLKKTGEAA